MIWNMNALFVRLFILVGVHICFPYLMLILWLRVALRICGVLFSCIFLPGASSNNRWKWSTRRKPAPVPLCELQISHDLTWDQTQAAALGSWWLQPEQHSRIVCGRSLHNACISYLHVLWCVLCHLFVVHVLWGLWWVLHTACVFVRVCDTVFVLIYKLKRARFSKLYA
jgi:hypothetical protein